MSFRARLFIAFLLTVLVPMIVLALVVRREMTSRLTSQYERRVESLVTGIAQDIDREGERIAGSVASLQNGLSEDNRFRRAAVDRVESERRYLLDYAGDAMRLAGLSMLQIQDNDGRILSSGHFRNEYDRLDPDLPRLLESAPKGTALVLARAPDERFLALARVDSARVGAKWFTIVAGLRVEPAFLERLSRGTDLAVTLVYPGGVVTSAGESDSSAGGVRAPAETAGSGGTRVDAPAGGAIVRELAIPFIDAERGALSTAHLRVSHGFAELAALRRSVDRYFLFAAVAAALLAIAIASYLSSRISRPLVELAERTSRVDLDRLDVAFDRAGKDEIGVLSRVLGEMTARLRASAVLIKDAERRATVGELSRQVNHDVKNGLAPIRNVFRHLVELSAGDPRQLSKVFEERRGTLESSISYLEDLASRYARLSTRGERVPIDVNATAERVVQDRRGIEGVEVRLDAGDLEGRSVIGDPVSLRRVLENLVGNAIESLGSRPGRVSVSTTLVAGESDGPWIRITVADTGKGMGEDEVKRIFDDFYTTKEKGTGLGLSIVRRLVMDLDGTVRVESEKDKGSRFDVDLPAAGAV
jgi:signal transduction histidine kinase